MSLMQRPRDSAVHSITDSTLMLTTERSSITLNNSVPVHSHVLRRMPENSFCRRRCRHRGFQTFRTLTFFVTRRFVP